MMSSALILKKNKKLSWEQVKITRIRGFEPVRVLAAGVCNSDIARAFHGGAYHYPLVMGHEIIGEVASGKRVAVYPLINCTTCTQCKLGAPHRCQDYDYLGSRRDGGFAHVVLAPTRNLIPIPSKLDPTLATLTEPAAVVVHASAQAVSSKTGRTLIIGDGTMGLLLAKWLRTLGYKNVSLLGRHDHKLAHAENFGATAYREADIAKAETFDTVFEFAGSNDAYRQAIVAVAPKGTIVLVGNCKADVIIPQKTFSNILRKEARLVGSWNSLKQDFRTASRFLASEPMLINLVTHTYPMHEGAKALATLAAGEEKNHIKTVLLT